MRRPFHIMYDMYLVIKNNFAWNPLPHWMSKISFSIYLSYRHLNAGIRMSLTVFRQKHFPSPLVHLQRPGQRVKPAWMAQPSPMVFLDGLNPTRIGIEGMIANRKKVRKVNNAFTHTWKQFWWGVTCACFVAIICESKKFINIRQQTLCEPPAA